MDRTFLLSRWCGVFRARSQPYILSDDRGLMQQWSDVEPPDGSAVQYFARLCLLYTLDFNENHLLSRNDIKSSPSA